MSLNFIGLNLDRMYLCVVAGEQGVENRSKGGVSGAKNGWGGLVLTLEDS